MVADQWAITGYEAELWKMELHEQLRGDPLADPEDRDEYTAKNVFWVPAAARWSELQAEARLPDPIHHENLRESESCRIA